MIGDFTSVNALEVDNSGPESFSSRIKQRQEQLWRDLDHREFSGVQVIRELARHHRFGPKAILPVVFTSLLNVGKQDDDENWSSRLGEYVFAALQTPQVYLDCVVSEERGSLLVGLLAVEEAFPDGLVNDLFGAFETLLHDLATDETSWDRTLADNARRLLPAKQAEARNQVNATEADFGRAAAYAVPAAGEPRPDQLAVCTPARRLTYAGLYQMACRVERELLDRDVKPNQMVGVLMAKGWEQIVAVLGIHFAGGAYLPIDSELPAERQKYLVENGGVKIVLTQSDLLPGLSVARRRGSVGGGHDGTPAERARPHRGDGRSRRIWRTSFIRRARRACRRA